MAIQKIINEPPKDLSRFNILIAGPKKIGKSSLAAQWPDSHVAEFEPGNAIHIRCSFTDIGTLKEYDEFLKEAAKTDWVKTWVFDQFNEPYQWCLQKICKDEAVLDPGEIGGYGKGWGAINREYQRRLAACMALKGGKVFTAHTGLVTVKTISKREVTKYQALLGKNPREQFVNPKIHNTWIMDHINQNRTLIIQGDDYYEASTANLEDHFRTPDGRSIARIPLGNSAKEGYENILACFNNEMDLGEEYLLEETSKDSPPVTKPKLSLSLKKD